MIISDEQEKVKENINLTEKDFDVKGDYKLRSQD